ncbi:MAG TPA: DUF5946 family protein [Chitinivibrionales bacterium]|nr:DUF5946 family protein [Chitinivibrionales bacterium]
MQPLIHCIGCRALVPDIDGPTFRYPHSSSAGCWKLYGEILEKEFSIYKYPSFHRLTLDAYAVQHPGDQTPQTTQSVNVHLAALHMVLVKKMEYKRVTRLMDALIRKNKGTFEWLDPPENRGAITVVGVVKAATFEEHKKLVEDWAESVYHAWVNYHATIDRLVETVLNG